MGKYFAWFHTCAVTKHFHILPDIGAVKRAAVFGAENDSCVNTTLPAIMPERPAQVGREKDNACLTLTVSLSSSRFCRFRSNKLIDQGVLEAAAGSGAGFWLIVRRVLLTEAAPGLVRAVTVTFVSLISYSAMAGLVGGGGIGNLAIQYGYYRFETGVMVLTVLVLMAAVQLGQAFGDRLAAALDRR